MVCLSVAHAGGERDRPHGPAAGRPRDGARADDDRRDAPAAAAPARARRHGVVTAPAGRRGCGSSSRSTCRRRPRGARALPRRRGGPGRLAAARRGHVPRDARVPRASAGGRRGGGRRRAARRSRRASRPALALGDGLLLPPRRARVLTVALRTTPAAPRRSCRPRSSAGLAAAGVYAPEARPFRPHVTVARIRPGARAAPHGRRGARAGRVRRRRRRRSTARTYGAAAPRTSRSSRGRSADALQSLAA